MGVGDGMKLERNARRLARLWEIGLDGNGKQLLFGSSQLDIPGLDLQEAEAMGRALAAACGWRIQSLPD